MAQFDVFRARGTGPYSFVVDIQHDVHARFGTRLVVPMVSRSRYTQPATRLHPQIALHGEEYVVLFSLAAAVPKAALGECLGSLAAHRATFIDALDWLLTGS